MITTIVIIALGSVVYHYVEGWSWFNAFYFSVITLTTIGYGDFSPQTFAGKAFTLLYILVGIGIILNFIHMVYHNYDQLRAGHEGKPQRNKRKSK